MRQAKYRIIWLLAATLAVGCNGRKIPDEPQIDWEEENALLRQTISEQQMQIDTQRRQIAQLRGLPTDNLDYLVQVERIEFGRFTQAYDQDEDGFDDGINVYLVTRDQEGDRIKTVGQVNIELWDLEAAPGDRQLGQWDFELDEILDYWLRGPFTDHFKFELAWPQGNSPRHPNLTIKLKFTETLTGKVFEQQIMVEARVR